MLRIAALLTAAGRDVAEHVVQEALFNEHLADRKALGADQLTDVGGDR